MAENAATEAPSKEAPAPGVPAAAAAPKEVLASAAFKACAEKLAQLVGKPVAIGAAERHDIAQWPSGHIPPKWLFADMAFEGELKGNVYLAMEEAPFYALGALLRKDPADAIKTKLASLTIGDADVEGIRAAAEALVGPLDEALRGTTGKKTQLKLVKFDVAAKMPMHPDANRVAFLAPIDVEGGLAKGSAALVFSATLGEWLGVPALAGAAAGAGGGAGAGQAGGADAIDPNAWWKLPAPKASALILLGKGESFDKAAAIAEAVKLPCHKPADEKSLREILDKDPAAALFVAPGGLKDPWLRLLAQLRKEAVGKTRRVVVALASPERRLVQASYVVPATSVWLPEHDPQMLAKALLAPLPCA